MKIVRHPYIVRLHEVCLQSLNYDAYICNDIPLFLLYVIYAYVSPPFSLFSSSIINLKVLASRTKIYIILELVTGGRLFDKIVRFLLFLSS